MIPAVTVVMATYNRPHLLPFAIESTLAQTYGDFELVIVNDAGCDVTDIVEGYKDKRIRLFTLPENKGAAHAYNYAIVNSFGRYIAYGSDDDIWYPNHLQTLVPVIDSNPLLGGAYSDMYYVRCDVKDGMFVNKEKKIEYSEEWNAHKMFTHSNFIPQPCMVHRREVLYYSGLYDEKLSVLIDWDLFRRMAVYTTFVHIPVPTGEFYYPRDRSSFISNIVNTNTGLWVACRNRMLSWRPSSKNNLEVDNENITKKT